MEDLNELENSQKKSKNHEDNIKGFAEGPVFFRGSQQFYNVYNVGYDYGFQLTYYSQPDSRKYTLMNDAQNEVKMTTFLDKKHILLQVCCRYMIFSAENG